MAMEHCNDVADVSKTKAATKSKYSDFAKSDAISSSAINNDRISSAVAQCSYYSEQRQKLDEYIGWQNEQEENRKRLERSLKLKNYDEYDTKRSLLEEGSGKICVLINY